MAEAPRRIEIPLTVEHDGETVEIGRLCYVREDVAERENAKLRELCRFVLMFTTMTDGCGDTCPYSCNNCQSECYFRKRARELGVEVDG